MEEKKSEICEVKNEESMEIFTIEFFCVNQLKVIIYNEKLDF